MVKKKFTEWFRPEVKPAIAGVYQRNYGKKENLGIQYSYWNGRRWSIFGCNPESVQHMANQRSAYKDLPWRGLAEKP